MDETERSNSASPTVAGEAARGEASAMFGQKKNVRIRSVSLVLVATYYDTFVSR